MTRRFSTLVAVVTWAIAGWSFLVSLASAEPIVGEESLGLSPNAAREHTPADAVALFKTGDFEGSLKIWKELTAKNSEMPPPQVIMAQLFLQSGLVPDAQKALNQATVEAPGDPEPYLAMAGIAIQEKDLAKAGELFKKAKDLLPAFDGNPKRKVLLTSRVQIGLASLAEARKDWTEAKKQLEALLASDPKNVAAAGRVAYCLFRQKDVEGALKRLRDAAKDNPKAPLPESVLAQFYQRDNDVENTKKWIAAAVTAAPKDAQTRIMVGQCALELGLMDEAQKHAIVAVKLQPKSLEAAFLRGLVAVCQKDYQTAQSFFETIQNRTPNNNFAATNNLALALVEQEDEAKSRRALEIAEANYKQFAKSSSACSTYAWVLYRVGKLDEAEDALRAAATLGPLSVDTAYCKARVLVDRKKQDEARQTLETVLKTPSRSMFREDAEDLLKELQKGTK
jgi:tetratricopeptide (TPR) repeat protein